MFVHNWLSQGGRWHHQCFYHMFPILCWTFGHVTSIVTVRKCSNDQQIPWLEIRRIPLLTLKTTWLLWLQFWRNLSLGIHVFFCTGHFNKLKQCSPFLDLLWFDQVRSPSYVARLSALHRRVLAKQKEHSQACKIAPMGRRFAAIFCFFAIVSWWICFFF